MEADPYATSYHEKKESTGQFAAKRLRKEAMSRGNRVRQQIEGKAPNWKNEKSDVTPTAKKGSTLAFVPSSYPGGLHHNLKRGS